MLTVAEWDSQRVARKAEGGHCLLLREYLLSGTEEISYSLSVRLELFLFASHCVSTLGCPCEGSTEPSMRTGLEAAAS